MSRVLVMRFTQRGEFRFIIRGEPSGVHDPGLTYAMEEAVRALNGCSGVEAESVRFEVEGDE